MRVVVAGGSGISRAREALGGYPRVSLEEGLRPTIDWFAAQSRVPLRPSEPSPVGRNP